MQFPGLLSDCSKHYYYKIQPNGLGNLTVLDMEGNFLSELVDYANTTISRDILLNVPDVNEELGWLGLKPNAKYNILLAHANLVL